MINVTLKNNRLNQQIEYFFSASDYYQEMINMIDHAQTSIMIQTYIFYNDKVGGKIIAHLKKAAARGVVVSLVVDRLGSSTLPNNFREELAPFKVNFGFFGNIKYRKILNRQYFVGRRMHHKVLLVDRRTALIGGINIGEPFLEWFDFAIKVYGPSCEDIFKVCYRYLKRSMKTDIKQQGKIKWGTGLGLISSRVVSNDSLLQVTGINRSINHYLKCCKKEVIIISSYFFPSRKIRKMIYQLASEGVKVRVICGHLSDVKIMQYATAFYYETFLKKGVIVEEWMPSILHGKAFVLDDDILSIGSYNFNYMSYLTNIELNFEVYDKSKISLFKQQLNQQLEGKTKKISLETIPQDPKSKLMRLFAFLLVRFISIISIIFIRNTPSVSLDEI